MSYLVSSPKDQVEPDAAHRFIREFLDATAEPPVEVPSVQELTREQVVRLLRWMGGNY